MIDGYSDDSLLDKKILILGGDGYLGWACAVKYAELGAELVLVDNLSKRNWERELDIHPLHKTSTFDKRADQLNSTYQPRHAIKTHVFNVSDYAQLCSLLLDFKPVAIIHFAEQPSAPFSDMDFGRSQLTLLNNVGSTHSVLWAIAECCPTAHLIKLGTMGEYGTPNIDIEEGWIDLEWRGRSQKYLFPRQASSLYHTSKILDTDLIWYFVRTRGLCVTDLMQGPVYGYSINTKYSEYSNTSFHYDRVFGTVLNRFVVQAAQGKDLTIYGAGTQKRGYIDINDSIRCIQLAICNPACEAELRIYNQITEIKTVNELADAVIEAAQELGISCRKVRVTNHRHEAEDHYYNPKYEQLKNLGLQENKISLEKLIDYVNFAAQADLLTDTKYM